MKKFYILVFLILAISYSSKSQTVLFDQPVDGTNGIISDILADSGFGTFSSDDFILDDNYIIEIITVPGFANAGDISALMTGLDIYIYSDVAGLPSSDPTASGTGLLEIINLPPTSPAITVIDNDITIDITVANGSEFNLSAGTYWLVVAPRVADDASRWNWFQSSAGGNAQLFDEGNFGGLPWTDFLSLGLTFDSLAFTISGSPNLSVNEFGLNSIRIYPNPVKDLISIDDTINISKLELFSVTGQLIYKSTNTRTIDMSSFHSGLYLLRVSNESGSITRRIIKE